MSKGETTGLENYIVKCGACGSSLNYSLRHDALFCEKCDKWAEQGCQDDSCGWCRNRPEKPSMVEA